MAATLEAPMVDTQGQVHMGLVVNHPHSPHSHYLEECYAYPAGLQEADPQV